MAKVVGLAASTIQGIWKVHGLAPHRWRQFKLAKDPAFAEKLHKVVGLYVARRRTQWCSRSTRKASERTFIVSDKRSLRRWTVPSRACR